PLRVGLPEHAGQELLDPLGRRLARRRPDEQHQGRSRVALEDGLRDLASEKPRPARQEDVVADSGGFGDRLLGFSVHELPFERWSRPRRRKTHILSALDRVDQEDDEPAGGPGGRGCPEMIPFWHARTLAWGPGPGEEQAWSAARKEV